MRVNTIGLVIFAVAATMIESTGVFFWLATVGFFTGLILLAMPQKRRQGRLIPSTNKRRSGSCYSSQATGLYRVSGFYTK